MFHCHRRAAEGGFLSLLLAVLMVGVYGPRCEAGGRVEQFAARCVLTCFPAKLLPLKKEN